MCIGVLRMAEMTILGLTSSALSGPSSSPRMRRYRIIGRRKFIRYAGASSVDIRNANSREEMLKNRSRRDFSAARCN